MLGPLQVFFIPYIDPEVDEVTYEPLIRIHDLPPHEHHIAEHVSKAHGNEPLVKIDGHALNHILELSSARSKINRCSCQHKSLDILGVKGRVDGAEPPTLAEPHEDHWFSCIMHTQPQLQYKIADGLMLSGWGARFPFNDINRQRRFPQTCLDQALLLCIISYARMVARLGRHYEQRSPGPSLIKAPEDDGLVFMDNPVRGNELGCASVSCCFHEIGNIQTRIEHCSPPFLCLQLFIRPRVSLFNDTCL